MWMTLRMLRRCGLDLRGGVAIARASISEPFLGVFSGGGGEEGVRTGDGENEEEREKDSHPH